MLPLHLRSNAHSGRRRTVSQFIMLLALTAVGMSSLGLVSPVRAQDDPPPKKAEPAKQDPPAAPSGSPAIPNFHVRPKVTADPQRTRRTIQINGLFSETKYDPFYAAADGPIKGTVYCNWDDNFLYLAARTDVAATLVFDIDASNDGWLRGADNLEVVVGAVNDVGNVPSVTARLLDAGNGKEAPAWRDLSADAKQVQAAGKLDASGQFVEVAIPKNLGGIALRSGAAMGLRGEFVAPGLASEYAPTPAFEPHLLMDAMLVDMRGQAALVPPTVVAPTPPPVGMIPRLTISDNKCVPGQKLFATLELINQTDAPVTIKALTWAGQGSAANAVNTMRDIAVPTIGALKRLKLTYKSSLAASLQPGAYTLTATAELSNGRQIQSSASFLVVDPVQPQISILPDPVTVVGPTSFAVSVDVVNANPGQMNCDIELQNMPTDWEVEGGRKKLPLTIDREDARGARQFVLRLPAATAAGDYPIDATVTWHGRVWKLHTVAHVIHGEAAKTP